MSDWQQHEGGWRWRVDAETGLILAERKAQKAARLQSRGVDGAFLYRTKGAPSSMVSMFDEHWPAIENAADMWEIPPQFLFALIGIEAVRGGGYRWDPRSLRKEPGYVSDEETPRKVSPGLMQTLITTARGEAEKRGLYVGELVDRELLFQPFHSLVLGGAYYRRQLDRYGFDPLKAMAAYNAGSLRASDESGWNMRTYSPTRPDRFIAWVGDAVEVLNERGIWTGLVR